MPVLTRKNCALIGVCGTTDEAESCMSTLSKLWRGAPSESSLLREIDALAQPLRAVDDLDALTASIGDSRYVLLGEATHGTSEFYRWRDEISRRLIVEKGFSFIAVEGDWPDCYAVNRYVKGIDGGSAEEVLHA